MLWREEFWGGGGGKKGSAHAHPTKGERIFNKKEMKKRLPLAVRGNCEKKRSLPERERETGNSEKRLLIGV